MRLPVLFGLLAASAFSSALFADEPPALPEERVYVPFEELELLLKEQNEGVFLKKETFDKLSADAKQALARQKAAPDGTTLASANYAATFTERQLRIDATLRFRQFEEGWVTLPLPMTGLAVEQATLDDQPARIVQQQTKGGPTLVLLSEAEGEHVLKLTLVAQLTSDGSDRLAAVTLPPAASATITFTVPEGKTLVLGETRLEVSEEGDANTVSVSVGGAAAPRLALRLTDPQGEDRADALLFVSTAIGVTSSIGELAWSASATLQVFGQKLDEVTCVVPADLEVTAVESPGLEAWSLEDDPNNPQSVLVRLSYREPFGGDRTIALRGVSAPDPGTPWQVPTLVVRGATSHVGKVRIDHPQQTRLELVRADRARRQANATGDGERFEFWAGDFVLEFVTAAKERELLATGVLTRLDVERQRLRLSTVFTLQTLYAPAFEFDAELPPGFTVTSVLVGNQTVKWLRLEAEPGQVRISVPLPQPLAPGGSTQVTLSAEQASSGQVRTARELPLPKWTLPDASVVQGGYVVVAPDDWEIDVDETSGLEPTFLEIPGERAGFQFADDDFTGTLTVTRADASLATDLLAHVRLGERRLHLNYELTLKVDGGGLSEFEVRFPLEVPSDLRFALTGCQPSIREQSLNKTETENVWTIKLDDFLQGDAVLSVRTSLSRGELPVTIPLPRIETAERHSGVVAVEAAEDQRLAVTATGANNRPLPEVDPIDIPGSRIGYRPEERIVTAVAFVSGTPQVTLDERRFEKVGVPTVLGESLSLDTLLANTGQRQHRARLTFRAVGVASLGVELPEGADLWATLIDDQPVEIRTAGGRTVVPLPATGTSAAAVRTLSLFYTTAADSESGGAWVREPQPVFLSGSEVDAKPIVVLARDWTVTAPDDVHITGSQGTYRPVGSLHTPGFLSRVRGRLTSVSVEDSVFRFAMLLLCLGGIAVAVSFGRKASAVDTSEVRWGVIFGSLGCMAVLLIAFVLLSTTRIGCGMAALQESNVGETASAPQAAGKYQSEDGYDYGGDDAAAEDFEDNDEFYGEGESDSSEKSDSGRESGEAGDSREGRFGDGEPQPQSSATANPLPEPNMPGDPFGERDPRDGQNGSDDLFAQPNEQPPAAPQFAPPVADGPQPAPDPEPLPIPVVTPQPPARTPPARTATLSVRVDQELPEGWNRVRFEDDGAGAGRGLAVRAVTTTGRRTLFLFAAATMLLLAWVIRSASVRTKGAVFTLGLAVPMALCPYLPASLAAIADGVALGTLSAGLLWIARSVLHAGRARFATAALVLVCTVVTNDGVNSASAQDSKPATVSRDAGTQARSPLDTVEGLGSLAQLTQNSIVIPYRADEDPLSADQVFLPQARYRELLKLVGDAEADARTAPVAALIAQADLTAAPIEGVTDRVRVSGEVVLFSLAPGPTTLRLPLGSVALVEASSGGDPVPLQSIGGKDPGYQVTLPTPGEHRVRVVFDVPARLGTNSGAFTVPFRNLPAGRLTVTVPGAAPSVSVTGSPAAFNLQSDANSWTASLPLTNANAVRVAWSPQRDAAARESLVLATTSQTWNLGDAGGTLSTQVAIEVRQGVASELAFDVPADVKLQAVTGADVASWTLGDAEDGRRAVVVRFRRGVSDQTSVTLRTWSDIDYGDGSATVSLPTVQPVGVTREVGTVSVTAGELFALRVEESTGLRQIQTSPSQPNNAPDANGSADPVRLSYRFVTRPTSLTLLVTRRQPEAIVLADHAVFVQRQKLSHLTRLRVTLSGQPRSQLVLTLPLEFRPLRVSMSGLSDWYVSEDGNGDPLLVLEAASPLLGSVDVAVSGFQQLPPEADFAEIAVPSLTDATRYRGRLSVRVDPGYAYEVDDAEGWKSLDGRAVGFALVQQSERPADLVYQATGEPGLLLLTLAPAEAELSGESVNFVTVTDSFVAYGIGLRWTVRQAATDRFSFMTPKWLAERLAFRTQGLRQVKQVDRPGDRVEWTVTTQQPVENEFFLFADATLGPPTDDKLPAARLRFVTPKAPGDGPDVVIAEDADRGLALQSHFVVLANQSRYQLTLAEPVALADVEVSRIPFDVPVEMVRQASAIGRVTGRGGVPEWNVRSFPKTEQAAATVLLAELTTVIAADGTYRLRAEYLLRNRARQFLALRPPADSRVLSVFVADKPSRPVRPPKSVGNDDADANSDWTLVALPKTSAADKPFKVTVVFTGSLPEPGLPSGATLTGRDLELPSPEVIGLRESKTWGVPVTQTKWSVHLPDSVRASVVDDSSSTNVVPLSEDEAERLLLLSRLDAAEELLDVLESDASDKAKLAANRNLIEIQKDVLKQSESREYSYGKSGRKAKGKAERELEERTEALQQRLSQFNQEQGQVAGGEGELSYELKSLDEDRQREAVGRQFERFNVGNSATGIEMDSKSQSDFDDFSTRTFTEIDAIQSKPTDGKPGKKVPDVTRYNQQSKGDYSGLNDQLESQIGGLYDGRRNDGWALDQPDGGGRVEGFDSGANGRPQSGERWDEYPNQAPGGYQTSNGGVQAGGFGGGGFGPQGLQRHTIRNQTRNAVPGGELAIIQREKEKIARNHERNERLRERRDESLWGQLNNVEESAMGIADEIQFPHNWEELSRRRRGPQSLALGESGGLSLAISLPTDGEPLRFSKVGGKPKLTLSLWPEESVERGVDVSWSLIWIAAGVVALLVLLRGHDRTFLCRVLPILVLLASGIGVVAGGELLPLCGTVFVVASLWLTIAWPKANVEPEADVEA